MCSLYAASFECAAAPCYKRHKPSHIQHNTYQWQPVQNCFWIFTFDHKLNLLLLVYLRCSIIVVGRKLLSKVLPWKLWWRSAKNKMKKHCYQHTNITQGFAFTYVIIRSADPRCTTEVGIKPGLPTTSNPSILFPINLQS